MTTERFNAEVGADISEFRRKMQQVDEQMRELATGVSVEINLALTEFYAEIARVKSVLADLEADKVSIEIEAALNDLMADLLQVRSLAQDLDGESIKIDIHLDDNVTNEIIRLLYELEALGKEKVKIRVDLDTQVFYTQLLMVRAELQALEREVINIKIDIDSGAVLADIALIRAQLDALINNAATITVDANTLQALLQLSQINKATKKIPRNIIVRIWFDYTNAMKQYATTVRAFAEAAQQIFGGALVTLIPVLSQLISVLIGLIGSLGVMIGVLAGQFMVLASAVGVTALGLVGFAAVAIPTIKNLFDETAKLTAEQQRAKASWDAFKATYDDLVKATEQPVLQAFTSAMNAANTILKSLEPLVVSVSQSMATLMAAFEKSVNSAPIQKIFDTFNKYGSSIFENMVEGIGHFTAAIGSMIAAFTPAADAWSDNFLGMMQSFAAWADGLTESARFQAFVDYILTYMPVISDIFGNLIVGIVEFFAAFSGMGGNFMTSLQAMTEQFQQWASTLGENDQFQRFLAFIQESTPAVLALLGNLWNLLINLGIAFAPIGAVVLDLTNKFLVWFNSMLEVEGFFSRFIALLPVVLGVISALAPIIVSIGVLIKNLVPIIKLVSSAFSQIVNVLRIVWGVISMGTAAIGPIQVAFGMLKAAVLAIATPFNLAVAAIGLLIGAAVLAYNKVEWFRNMVDTAWEAIKDATVKAFKAVSDTISSAISGIVKFGKEMLGEFEKFWSKHGEAITTIVKTAFEVVYELIAGIMKTIGVVIETAWNVIVSLFKIAWDLISGIIQIAIDLVLGIVSAGMALLQGDWETAWDTIVETAKSIGTTIVDTFGGIIDSVIQIGKDIIGGLIEGITSMFDSVASALGKLTDKIPRWVKDALGIKSPSRVMAAVAKWIPAGIAKGITDNINMVKTATLAMSKATMPDFSKTIRATEFMAKEVNKVSAKYAKENVATRLEEFEKALGEQKKWYDLGADYEYTYWKEVSKHLQAGTAAKRKALDNANKAYEALLQEQYNNETKFIDQATKYNALSLTDRIAAYEQYMKQYKVGSEQQVAYEEKIYDAKKELYDGMKALADDYLAKVQDVYQRLADEEKQLRDEFQQTYDSRVDTLRNTWGLFDEVNLTEMVQYDDDGKITKQIDLLQNMRDQVQTLSQWMNSLFELESRGLSGGLIEELQNLGPNAAAEIAALTNMTQAELNEFQSLWETKTALASKQATKELAGARLAMEEEIKKLHQNAGKELDTLKNTFEKQVRELRYGAEDGFNILTATLPEIGKHAVQGLIDGMKSMEGPLKKLAQNMATSVQNILGNVLGVEGSINAAGSALTSSLQSTGLTAAVNSNYQSSATQRINTNVVNETEFAEPQVNVNLHNQFNGEEFETWIDGRSANRLKLNSFKKG